MANSKKIVQAAAGAGGGEVANVEDFFSTYVYSGNGTAYDVEPQAIENGIKLGQYYSGTGSDGSALFGGNGDYVTVSGLSSSITGDFTIELFGYNTSPASEEHVLLGPWGDGTHGNQILVRFTGETLGVSFPSFEINLAKSIHGIGRNEWFHLAISRSSGTLKVFANGVEVNSSSYSGTVDLGTLYIGSERSPFNFNGNWEGNISNVRVSTSTAFYTSTFALPSANLTAISGTGLLTLQGGTPFVDNSGNSHTVTQGGSVSAASEGAFPVEDGDGGLVWTKRRVTDVIGQTWHNWQDTERGTEQSIFSNNSNVETTVSGITSFNGDGYTIGVNANFNYDTQDYVSYTFKKQERFFDVVTWTGDGTSDRQISHNLGVAPGCIFVKKTNDTREWAVYHRSTTATHYAALNLTDAFFANSTLWNDTEPTDTVFTVGNNNSVNTNGDTYVAYLFAHNDGDGGFGPDGDKDAIKCGSYTGNGSSTGPEIDLGFEPQWVLIKCSTQGGTSPAYEWYVFDSMRGMTGEDDTFLTVNDAVGESSGTYNYVKPEPTGFKIQSAQSRVNASGQTYIYIAISRGPMAVPESASDVFDIDTRNSTGTGVAPGYRSSSGIVDFALRKNSASGTDNWQNMARLIQGRFLEPNTTNTESTSAEALFDYMNGYKATVGTNSGLYSWMWKRAPQFCDVVTYKGNNTQGRSITHNLGVAPEMIWVKARDFTRSWNVYHKDLTPSGGVAPFMEINSADAVNHSDSRYPSDPTDTTFVVGNSEEVNSGNYNYIAYLFASLDGVSKVGSYTGTGGSGNNIDCGFSSGARFILIKNSSSSEQWYVWDTERGISAGNDPFLRLNSTAAQTTDKDYIDPYSAGFTVNEGASGDAAVNKLGETYIFYAIAI